MKKKQLNLKSLKIQSFITEGSLSANKVKGGSYLCETEADPFFCGGYGGGGGGTTAPCGTANATNCGNCSNYTCNNPNTACSCQTCGCPTVVANCTQFCIDPV